MGFFKGIFGGDEQPERPVRTLDHPKSLQIGDMLKLGFTGEEGLSAQTFTVKGIDTQDLGGEALKKALFNVEGVDGHYRMAVVKERGEEWLEVARQCYPEDVLSIFEQEAFIDLLDPETGVNHSLARIGEPAEFSGWTCAAYRQEAGHNAYFHHGDYRNRSITYVQGEAFSYYRLVSDERLCALEVQVYDGGRTDVWLCKLLPLHKVEELWPAA